jgi:uncharacterized protein (TIGR02145 family)
MKKLTFTFLITTICAVGIFAQENFNCGDPFTDPRDGQIYYTVQIGDQCWMAENLNIGTMLNGVEEMTDNGVIEKYCYDNDPANCEIYGGFYQWNEMMEYSTTAGVQGICPMGWRIPTDDEWKILEGTVDSQYPVGDSIWNNNNGRGYDVGLNLKSTSGWYNNGNGTDLYGFCILPSGLFSHNSGDFALIEQSAYLWTSSVVDSNTSWSRGLFFSHDNVYRNYAINDQGFSVRCLENEISLGSDFEAEPTSGLAPLTVQFTDLSEGNIISWQWDFNNDGTIDSEEQNPEWTYTESGTYSVSLTVSDGVNEDTESKEDYITVTVPEQHFNFIGGNTSDPIWTLYIAEATLNNIDLGAFNEIAIFDGELMVGLITLTQVCTPENQFQNALLTFNTLANGSQGYTPGNNVTFKCWDASENLEIQDFQIVFDDPYGDAWTENIFPEGEGQYSIPHIHFEGPPPVLISAQPGIEEITLTWEAILESNKTVHFDFSGCGGADPIWTIYIGGATFNGSDMEAGDEIGIFDGDLLVGVFYLYQVCTPDNQFENALAACSQLTSGPGYQAGNIFSLKAWDDNLQIESTSFECTFSDPYGSLWSEPVFPPGDGQISMAEIVFSSLNFPLFNVYYEDGTLVAENIEGNTFTDTDLIGGNEYCYYVTQIFESGLESSPSNILCAVPLAFGNITGIVYDTDNNPVTDVTVIIEENGDEATTNESGEYFFIDIPTGTYTLSASRFSHYPETISNVEVIGYETTIVNFYLEAKNPTLIDAIPGNEEISLTWEAITEGNSNIHFEFEGGDCACPKWAIYIGGATFSGADMEAGDEIGIFDGDLLVGVFYLNQVCTPDNQFENCFAVYCHLYSGPGYTVGNPFTLKGWDKSLQVESTSFDCIMSDPYGGAYTGTVFPPGDIGYSMIEVVFNSENSPVFNVYYENGTPVATNVEETTYIDTDLIAGEEYCYYVTQVFENGEESAASNIECAVPLASPPGEISGLVNDTDLNPIQGAMITVEGTSYSVISGADGAYIIQDVEPGTYNVTASAEGFCPETIYDQIVISEQTTIVDFTLIRIQTFDLVTGYQFVSTRLIPDDQDMLAVLENNLNDNLCFVRNSGGYTVTKIGPIWVNSIGNWVTTEGYLFKMYNDDQLTISGVPIDPQTPINLSTGYQMISYLPAQSNNALDMFEDVLENLDFVRNSGGFMIQKIGPVWVNSIGDMQPGEGYLVKMNALDILIYPVIFTTCGDPFTDDRDEQIYNTVQIGDQCWMAENLNIGTMINGNEEMTDNGVIEKYCYDDVPTNCDEYGGLYKWNEMMVYTTTPGVQGVCPSGWHILTDDEWKLLEGTVDSQYPVGDPIWNNTGYRGYDAGLNLKSTTGWNGVGNGSGLYDYEALPGGYRHPDGNFNAITHHASFWSSSEGSSSIAWYRDLYYSDDDVYRNYSNKNYGFSVRCLKNETLSKSSDHSSIQSTIHFAKKEGNPLEAVWAIYFEKETLNAGDEIAVFDGEILVGSGVIVSDNIYENAIPVFSNLYKVGNKPIIKVWNNNENKEYILSDYTFSNPYGDAWTENVFPSEDGEYSLLHFSTTGLQDDKLVYDISIYPNPAKENITIQSSEKISRVEILNSIGQRIYNEIHNKAFVEINIKRFEQGVYIFRIENGSKVVTKKVIVE